MTLPIVCTLTPETIRTRRAALLPGLIDRATSREDTPDGLRLRFAPSSEILQALAATVDAERKCCRFLRFEIGVESGDEGITLTLSGPPGTREFLEALLSES